MFESPCASLLTLLVALSIVKGCKDFLDG